MASRRKKSQEDHEAAAAGMEFDENPIRDRFASLGAAFAEEGPRAVLDEIENLLPDEWREQVRTFPVTAVLLGVSVGIYLGMKHSDEVIAAGSSALSAAAMANVSRFMSRGEE
jgi:hypothetical protein